MLNVRRRLCAATIVLGLGLSACATQTVATRGPVTEATPSIASSPVSPSPSAAVPSPSATTPSPESTPSPSEPPSTTPSVVPTPSTATKKPVPAATTATPRPKQSTASADAPVPVTSVTGGTVPGRLVDCSVSKCVALTFDDGPNSSSTVQIIDALTRANAPATFFMLSSMAAANPGVVARIAANQRFEIANHTVSHPNLNQVSAATIRAQVSGSAVTLSQLSGRKITLFRPPYGNRNPTVVGECRGSGQALVLWDVDTEDWKNRNAATTTARAVQGAKAGSIILLHDIHPSTAAAIPGMVAQLRAKGFVLVTVSEVLGGTTPGNTYSRRA